MKKEFMNVCTKINNKFLNFALKARNITRNEKGVTTIEWVGLAFVILVLMFAISTAMKGSDGGIASAITSKIAELVGKVGKGE